MPSAALSQLAGWALEVTGTTTLDAGSQAVSLTEAANKFGGLVTVKAGQTAVHASENLNVALANTGKHVYQGTVPAAVKAKRRAKNKVARLARRAGR